MDTLLRQRILRRLGHVRRKDDGRIPKDIIYSEPASGRRTTGRPHLRYRSSCLRKRYEGCRHRHYVLEGLTADRTKWKSALKQHLKSGEDKLMTAAADKRARKQKGGQQLHPTRNHTHNVLSATKTATPTFSATSDAATTQQEIKKIKNKNIRMYHPWSSLTDGY